MTAVLGAGIFLLLLVLAGVAMRWRYVRRPPQLPHIRHDWHSIRHVSFEPPRSAGERCPCGGMIVRRHSARHGPFLGCSNFRNGKGCRRAWLPDGRRLPAFWTRDLGGL